MSSLSCRNPGDAPLAQIYGSLVDLTSTDSVFLFMGKVPKEYRLLQFQQTVISPWGPAVTLAAAYEVMSSTS